jgi:hypothetical protein
MSESKLSMRKRYVNKFMKWKPGAILACLTRRECFLANPEVAFGIVRTLNTRNKLRASHIWIFLETHPVWSQMNTSIGCAQKPNDFYTLCAESAWGKKVGVKVTHQISGTTEIRWETKKGMKKQKVKLSAEFVAYGGDTRTFMSLCMGGSQIRSTLLKDGTPVDRRLSDDDAQRRFVIWGERLEERDKKEMERGLPEIKNFGGFMSDLMNGQTITNEEFFNY